MKYHITNIYNANENEPIVKKQHAVSKAAHAIGFYELGLFRYNVASDNASELSRRLDGIIAGIERGDVVFVQLPTGLGELFETLLIQRICAYGATAIPIVFRADDYDSMAIFRNINWLIADNGVVLKQLERKGLSVTNLSIQRMDENTNPILIQMELLEKAASAIALATCTEKIKTDATEEMIHVCMAIHDRTGFYCHYAATTVLSMLENTEAKVCIHFLVDETVSLISRQRLCEVALKNGGIAVFHDIDSQKIKLNNSWLELYSIGSLFRLQIPEILSIPKIIYLDSDLLFLKDIQGLWDVDISDYDVAAVHDIGFENGITEPEIINQGYVEIENYFNSGVMILNLDRIRAKGSLMEMVLDFFSNSIETILPDQDALNYIFRGSTLLLDSSWNTFTRYERLSTKAVQEKVYHFVGEPYINWENPTEFDELYIRTRERTPWGFSPVLQNEFGLALRNAFGHCFKVQHLLRQQCEGRKKRIFYGGSSTSMRNIGEMLCWGKGDYYVDEEYADRGIIRDGLPVFGFEKLKMEEKGSYIVLVLPEADGGTAISKLEGLGLEGNKDYFVVPLLMTFEQGGYLL